ncbi:uncharacterized protein LOC115633328 [Scaptodrosophila lebanonensis]|uniref:Uncharacterized protein LOC115633328 n=1 Tax=Drosophila lebanonensis TaxID=7225 RepID=A0A6J2UDS0_DROLE|nr:uncharacterized protein LOC115633328 [Scaptodrosophila lebanonensis]
MENTALRRANRNFNNMRYEEILWEAQRENYINLEIVRHYRRAAALPRFPVFDIAIDAAIARHGLYTRNGNSNGNGNPNTEASESNAEQDMDMCSPPVRRQRLQLPSPLPPAPPPPPIQLQQLELERTAGSAGPENGHYVALAHMHIYSANMQLNDSSRTATNSINSLTNNNNINNIEQDSEGLNEVAMKETIESLGLRRN